jgi:hypothetical protein
MSGNGRRRSGEGSACDSSTRQAGFVCSIVGIPRNWVTSVSTSEELQRQWPEQCQAGENQTDR